LSHFSPFPFFFFFFFFVCSLLTARPCGRNLDLEQQGFKKPTVRKTGTTIVGMIYKDGVVLGADTRATGGSIVCDKNCEKIHYIAPNIWCCGAGTAADTEHTTELIASKLALLRLATGQQSRVRTACQLLKELLFRHRGEISAALVLGGVDVEGSHLFSIHPHGSVDPLPFVTMGSGSLAAMAVFEAHFQENMVREDAVKLVHDAIEAGIVNDLGSGSNVDVMVITPGKHEMFRNMDTSHSEKKYKMPGGFKYGNLLFCCGIADFCFFCNRYPQGTTAVIKTEVFYTAVAGAQAMDVSD
jgi:20S proteasome subunit beta 2